VKQTLQQALGGRIRQLKKQRAWSQEKLAEKAKLHWTYVGQVERGERNLTLQSIETISRAFHLKISELFRGVD